MANPKTKNILISMMIVMSSAFLFGSILLFGRVAYAQTDSSQSKPYTFQGDDEFVPGAFDKELCGQDPESCEQKPEDMGDEAEQTEAESEEESTSTSASAGLSIKKDSYSYTGYADNREVVSQAIFVDRYNQTTSIGTITVESNNTTRINTGIYSTGHTFFEKGGDVLGGAFFADLEQNTYILPKIGARVNVSGTNVFALGKNINISNKNKNVFVYNNEGGQFAPQNSDVFYINATEGLGINGASSKKGINVHGGVNVGEVNVAKSCVDNMSMGLQYNAGVMGIAKQSPGCMVGCRSNSISLADYGKWYLIDQSEVCKQWCRNNSNCKTDNPVEENRTSTPAQCTGFDIKAHMKKCDSQDALLGNFKDITFIGYLTEACPSNANEIANPCAYTCQDKYRVQSGACVYDPNRSCESWTVNYDCNGGSQVAGYSLTGTSTNKSLTLLTGGCSKESENKKLIGWSSNQSSNKAEYGLGSGLTLGDKDCSKTLYAVYQCMGGFIPDGNGGCVDDPAQSQCATRKYMCDNNGRRYMGTNTGHDAENQEYNWRCGKTECGLCEDGTVPSTLHNGACAKGPKYKRTCINQKSVCINETTNQPVDDKQCDQWSRPICNGPTPMTCMGTLPANAELWNTNAPTNNTTNYTYSATQTLLACRYKCNSGYTYDGEKCEKGPKYKRTCVNQKSVCINETTNQPVEDKQCDQWSRPICNGPTPMACMGTLPANAELWNTNAPTNNTTNYTYSATQTSLACRYKCNSGYSYVNGKCSSIIPPTPEYQWACLTSCDGKIWNDTSAFDERTRRCGNISDSLSCANSRDNCRWDPDIGKCVASLNNSSLGICNSKEEKCVKKSCLSGGSGPLSSDCIDDSGKQCKEQPHIQCEQPSPVDETINIKITCKQNKTNESWSSTTYTATADKPVPFNIIIGQEILLYNNTNGVRKFTTPQTIATYRITSGSTGSSKIAAGMATQVGGKNRYVVGISSFASGVNDFNGKTRITNQSLKQTKDINGKEYIITLKDCAEPICGTNLENSYNTPPNPFYVALCDVGTASNVTTLGNNFTWTCSLPGVSPQSCYVKKNTYKCTGTLPENAVLWNTNTPTNNTTNYTYSATQTSLACRYKCIDDYYYSHLTNKCTKEGIDTLEPLDPKDCAFAKWDCLGVPNGSVPNCMVAGVPNGKCKCSPANARCYGGNVRY